MDPLPETDRAITVLDCLSARRSRYGNAQPADAVRAVGRGGRGLHRGRRDAATARSPGAVDSVAGSFPLVPRSPSSARSLTGPHHRRTDGRRRRARAAPGGLHRLFIDGDYAHVDLRAAASDNPPGPVNAIPSARARRTSSLAAGSASADGGSVGSFGGVLTATRVSVIVTLPLRPSARWATYNRSPDRPDGPGRERCDRSQAGW